MKKHLPNLFTCLNLLAGCMAAVMVFRNDLETAAFLVFIAAFFDLLDGMLARILKVYSQFGKELDSLADVVSFGFVPGAILFKLLQLSDFPQWMLAPQLMKAIQFSPFILTVFSALRLAKFNLDKRQSVSFIGLPTPASTLLVVSLPLIIGQYPGQFDSILLDSAFILILSGILSFLLVSEIPLFSLKFDSLGLKENLFQYILLVISLLLIFSVGWLSIPFIFILYFILSIVQSALKGKSVKK